MSQKRILIIGGVAGGASCAARARRLDESAKIIVFERGPYVSFANCGLPYHVGDVIPDESDLLLVTPTRFKERFDIEVRVRNEVLRIDREAREVEVRDIAEGKVYREPYDALVLATGAGSVKPPLEGLDLPGVFTLRTVPDTRRLKQWIADRKTNLAVVVGAGFVGLEVAENLRHRGLEVHVIERDEQVLPPIDPEMADHVREHLEEHGVRMHLGKGLKRIEAGPDGILRVHTDDQAIDAGVVILAVGVKPETTLAIESGITLGSLGGIEVDASMRTNDPHVWAVGDVVEDQCFVTGKTMLLPLAGPANREGRLAADVICGRDERFRGVQGTVVCGLFDITIAATGVSEKRLSSLGIDDYQAVWLHPNSHVSYYPGAKPIHLKLVFERETGRVLGAQAVGMAAVEKRIDVIAMAIQMHATVFDLEQAELCYAPQFGAAKDPVNVAGMIAANHLRGHLELARWDDLERTDALLVDVREAHEFAKEHIPNATNIPLSELRDRIAELPTDREVWLYCHSGKRSYDAARSLMQRGFLVRNLPGGIESWRRRRLP